jgi:cell division protein FtsI (penicillin-binding protein 3)
MSEASANHVLHMMESVTQPGGTAQGARVTGYRIAGKTGTGHKFVDGSYDGKNYLSSFVGLAPASDPRLVVAVVIDEPRGRDYYGGLIAAPVFSKVMSGALRFMALPPDAPFDHTSAPPGQVPLLPEALDPNALDPNALDPEAIEPNAWEPLASSEPVAWGGLFERTTWSSV